MALEIRAYDQASDYERVNRFLVEAYEPRDVLDTWLQPRWEYMHFHPLIVGQPLERCGLVEEDGRMVAVVHFEHNPAFVYTQVRPGYDHATPVLFDWAQKHLGGVSQTYGRRVLGVFIDDFDATSRGVALERGFDKQSKHHEEHARISLDVPLPDAPVPPGYRLRSLAEENDLRRINRVLWRGFGHPGEPPESEIEGRRFMQSAPNFRPDLTVVAVAPDGAYAAFGGMWYVPENRVAYVEPVATDPDHRRRRLGSAVVVETLRRVRDLGARCAWVGSGQEFYRTLGFRVMFTSHLWLLLHPEPEHPDATGEAPPSRKSPAGPF